MTKYVFTVWSGDIETMELCNFEGVFETRERAEEFVERCQATIVKDNDNYYYNSCEVYEIRQDILR